MRCPRTASVRSVKANAESKIFITNSLKFLQVLPIFSSEENGRRFMSVNAKEMPSHLSMPLLGRFPYINQQLAPPAQIREHRHPPL